MSDHLSEMVNAVQPEDAARGWVGIGDWKQIWKTLYPHSTASECRRGGVMLSMRADVQNAIRKLQNDRITERLSKDNLLAKLEVILEDEEEKTGDRLSAIKLYAELAGMSNEDRKQMTTIVLSAGDVRVLEDARRRLLPDPSVDAESAPSVEVAGE